MDYIINNNSISINENIIEIDGIIFIDFVAQGGNAIVFRAYGELLDRYLAVKIWVTNPADGRDKYLQALREAKKIASLNHKSIVDIYGAHSHQESTISLEMEFVEGVVLRDYLESNKTDILKLNEIWHQLYDAISYSYHQGIYHGDLHYGNILLIDDHNIKVIDFGTSLFSNLDTKTESRESRLLLRLFNRMFGSEYSGLIDGKEFISDKPEIVLNITRTIVLFFEHITTLVHYLERNNMSLGEVVSGQLSACVAGCPFINLASLISSMRERGIAEHYINVFLNGCLSKLKLVLSHDPESGVKGFFYDARSINDLAVEVNLLLEEVKCLHETIYQEDRCNYLSKVK